MDLGSKDTYEFCPRCDANLTFQKDYSNKLPYWVCKGCGETLINPAVPGEIAWICDQCESMLNIQEGFTEDCGEWICSVCGYTNRINKGEIYVSEGEFQADARNPYKGLSDEAVLELSLYVDEKAINHRDDIVIVRNVVDNQLYVKKILKTYDISVYQYLEEHPLSKMPRIHGIYEGNNNLIVIEEYISGHTIEELLKERLFSPEEAVNIANQVCSIVSQLHKLEVPIIHRDIKPSNIILNSDREVYLLDFNVAKWYRSEELEDTKLLGTQYYAAPEQMGFGFTSSNDKTDVYAIGVLLNVMITGKLPKEERVKGSIWGIIEKCICLESKERYSDTELMEALSELLR